MGVCTLVHTCSARVLKRYLWSDMGVWSVLSDTGVGVSCDRVYTIHVM